MRIRCCEHCGKAIKGRSHKRFCSDKCRYDSWMSPREDASPCYYCGMPADSIDHVPPITVRPRLLALGLDKRYKFVEVNACKECNSLIGARALWTLSQRKKFIKKALKLKYAKALRTANYTDSELKEFGSMLRDYILTQSLISELIKKRLAW